MIKEPEFQLQSLEIPLLNVPISDRELKHQCDLSSVIQMAQALDYVVVTYNSIMEDLITMACTGFYAFCTDNPFIYGALYCINGEHNNL